MKIAVLAGCSAFEKNQDGTEKIDGQSLAFDTALRYRNDVHEQVRSLLVPCEHSGPFRKESHLFHPGLRQAIGRTNPWKKTYSLEDFRPDILAAYEPALHDREVQPREVNVLPYESIRALLSDHDLDTFDAYYREEGSDLAKAAKGGKRSKADKRNRRERVTPAEILAGVLRHASHKADVVRGFWQPSIRKTPEGNQARINQPLVTRATKLALAALQVRAQIEEVFLQEGYQSNIDVDRAIYWYDETEQCVEEDRLQSLSIPPSSVLQYLRFGRRSSGGPPDTTAFRAPEPGA